MALNKDENIRNYLPADFLPTEYDVICARGKDAFLHSGNKKFREIIDQRISSYVEAGSKSDKTNIVMGIVEQVRSTAPAGFIRFCNTEQLWYEIGDDAAREKVGQTIREKLTQQDPDKRAKKRTMRAINKAKRAATKVDLEPLEVSDAPDFPSLIRHSSPIMPFPPVELRGSQSAPDVMEQTRQKLKLVLDAASKLVARSRSSINHFGEQAGYNQSVGFPSLTGQSSSIPIPSSALVRSQSAPLGLLDNAVSLLSSQPNPLINFERFAIPPGPLPEQDVIPSPPPLNAALSSELEALAAHPPALNYGTSRDWFIEEGYAAASPEEEDDDFEDIDQLFEFGGSHTALVAAA